MLSLNSHYKSLYVYTEPSTRRSDFTYQQLGKRAFDIGVALLIAVTILSWLIPLLGLLIRIESPGPILFIQKRTGFRGVEFNCLKFRTMTYNPKADFQQATKYDNRVTLLGRFLRRTNLDEMPQFLNVLVGDMSIVGPRPHALQHSAQFWNTMPEYRKRYRVKPGITGLAQVRGCRGETDKFIKMQHRVKYDRFYNRKRSPALDMWICWLTIKSMIEGNMNVW
ncbi:sugar transferase [Spirosoma endophyticum]|uniref:Putative colanic acid biosysnthesis UDP-glucose lipid carrier transferase n=1 Tax=Spirosoma endophyticum TaxID=662367 RepID=A0A1I2FRH5_9BACT|nr:sugar transferase [Spirosoma endophyticum]SFF08014.1 putative colanic acid biosysnthesis UDP-glucose lipid carrier transferase [Spirosoma endophyticum]